MINEFFIECNPPKTTYQAHQQIFKLKNGRHFIGKNQKGKSLLKEWELLLYPHRPEQIIDGPLSLKIILYFPHKVNTPKYKKDKILPYITKPDLDNISKALLDAMQGTYITNDSRIYKLDISKYHSPNPGIYIRMEDG